MRLQLRSEFLKARTTRAAGWLVLAAVGITLFGAIVEAVSPSLTELHRQATQRAIFGANITAVLVSTIAGILVVTGEFRYGTIHPTLLFEPRRSLVLYAKLVVSCATGVVIAIASTAASFGLGYAFLAVRGVAFAISADHVAQLVVGTAVGSMFGALIGVATGELIRNQVNAVAALFAYAVAVDAALFGAAPGLGQFLPGKAGDALAGRAVDGLLAPAVGGLVFALWTLAFVVAALVSTERRDVVVR